MSGVNSGFCVVASTSVAVEPLGGVSFQSYVACFLPWSRTGISAGTLRLPVAVCHGRLALTVAVLWYVPDDVTTTTSNTIAAASESACGVMPVTMKRSCVTDSYLAGTGTYFGYALAASGDSSRTSSTWSLKTFRSGSVSDTVSDAVFASAAATPPVCFHAMLCRTEPSVMATAAFAVTVAPGTGLPLTATVTLAGAASADVARPAARTTTAISRRWLRRLMFSSPRCIGLHGVRRLANARVRRGTTGRASPSAPPVFPTSAAVSAVTPALSTTARGLLRRHRVRIELTRDPRVLATRAATAAREAELRAVVAGIDLRGVRDRAGVVEVHRGDLHRAARRAGGADEEERDDDDGGQRAASGRGGEERAHRAPDEERRKGEEEDGVEEAGDARACGRGEERGGGEAVLRGLRGEELAHAGRGDGEKGEGDQRERERAALGEPVDPVAARPRIRRHSLIAVAE